MPTSEQPPLLSEERFIEVVAHAPLVSIDLILQRDDGAALLGLRRNRPAQGYWCVPGGRILKDERVEDALIRIVRRELGPAVPNLGWASLGVYEHFFPDNVARVEGVSTHYVVIAHWLRLPLGELPLTADDQHEELRWFPIHHLLARDDVHPYTKAYFTARAPESPTESAAATQLRHPS